MNGATEATLAELLAVAQSMNVNLVSLNRLMSSAGGGGGSGGSTGSGGGLSGLAAAAGPAGLAMRALSGAASIVSGVFSTLGNIIGQVVSGLSATVSNLWNFAKMAANGTAKLSDFYDAFKDLPFLIGSVMHVFADIIRYQESMIKPYQEMTRVGASFSGSLTVMRDAATRSFMSLQEMTTVVRANSEIFATMGGSVDSGLRKFVDVQNKLMGPGSQYMRQLLGMGYTAQSVGELLGSVYQQQGSMTKTQVQNNNTVAEAVLNTAKELDLFSRATGKNREELEKELKQKSFDAAWKTFTQNMSAGDAKAAEAAITKAFSQGGQGAADGVKQLYMTGGRISVPITDAMKQFWIQTNGMGEQYVRAMYESTSKFKHGSQEQLVAQLKAARDMGAAYKDFIGPMNDTGAILSMQGNNFVNNAAVMNTALQLGGKSNKELADMAKAAAKGQKDAGQGSAAALMEAEKNIQMFGQMIMNLVNELIGPIAGQLIGFGGKITKELLPVFKKVTDWFKDTWDSLQKAYGTDGWEGVFKKLGEKMLEGAKNVGDMVRPLWEAMKPAMIGAFERLVEFMKPYFIRMVDYVADAANAWVFKETKGIVGEDPAQREKLRENQKNVSDQQAKIDFLKARYDDLIRQGRHEEAAGTLAGKNEVYRRLYESLTQMIEGPTTSTTEWAKKLRAGMESPVLPQRHSGTLGMTGNWWEKENQVVELQAGETVATPSQIAQIVGSASQNGFAQGISALNNTMNTLIAISRKIEENSRANVSATKQLSNNAFAMV